MSSPFLLFPWNQPFLPLFKAQLEQRAASGPLAVPLLIAPTSRPWQYLQALYAQDSARLKKPAIVPRLMTLNEVVARWYTALHKEAPAMASRLDCVLLLHEAVQHLPPAPDSLWAAGDLLAGARGETSPQTTQTPQTPLEKMDLDAFFPWGEKLSGLMEELFANGIEPADVLACEDEVLPTAAAVLASLGRLGEDYVNALHEHHLTTQGLALHEVASALDRGIPAFVRPAATRPVYIMGFHSLSGAQEAIVHALWKAGAQVCLHTDPVLADAEARPRAHWICRRHREWIETWQAETRLVQAQDLPAEAPAGARTASPVPGQGEAPAGAQRAPQDASEGISGETPGAESRFTYLSGYDLHSQLAELERDLQALVPAGAGDGEEDASAGAAADAAETDGIQTAAPHKACILLPRANLLMPLLHHIPVPLRSRLNIAMGLTLADSPVYQLLRDLLLLQQNRDEEGRYHWRRLLACVDSPLFAGLTGPHDEPVLAAVRRYRVQLCHGLRFVDPFQDVLRSAPFDDHEDQVQALTELLTLLVSNFAGVDTPLALAEALQQVCDHIRERGTMLRTSSPIDMEALFHVEHSLLPQLRTTLMKDEKLGLGTLLRIFDELCRAEHMAFETSAVRDPVTGVVRRNPAEQQLQIMNVLASTLLSFDQVFCLDITDDALPGNKKHDPLLPDSLRAVLGLPDLDEGDLEMGYAVHRLIQSSGQVHFYWQEGITRTHLFDGKKSRSRFVEEYIWEEEQAKGHVFEAGKPPLHVASCTLVPMHPRPRSLKVQDQVLRAMEATTGKPLSPSALDKYLACPLAFGFQRLAGLKELEMVNESDDPLGVGTLMHAVLEDYHNAHLNELPGDRDEASEELRDLFRARLADPSCLLRETLPPESLAMLRAVAENKLDLYARNQPADSCPIFLEHDLSASLDAAGRHIRLAGRIDRLDRRDRGLVVLDYKTSTKLPNIHPSLWWDTDFFERAKALMNAGTLDARDREDLHSLFLALREQATSVQLPCYVTMCTSTSLVARRASASLDWPEGRLADATYVPLAQDSVEVSFYGKKSKKNSEEVQQEREQAMQLCPQVVAVVAMHMQHTEELVQMRDTMRCGRCPYATLCSS